MMEWRIYELLPTLQRNLLYTILYQPQGWSHQNLLGLRALIENLEAVGMKAPYYGRQYWRVEHHIDDGMTGLAPKTG